ncbi:MAG: DUF3035 domain-containing protein [Alphaproteobacteria bacterium]|nr:DUF3035 domain-containing protein [Alphaproteobacteria bacterium]
MSNMTPLHRRTHSLWSVLVTLLFALPFLTGCGGSESVRDKLGLTRESPDEFAVVRRAPLEIPPGLTAASLPPPRPGAQRPQEATPSQEARSALVGSENTIFANEASESETVLLQKANVGEADPAIRRTVDQETAEIKKQKQPVIQKLTGLVKEQENTTATVVDAKAEYERLKKNAAEGKPATEGDTPFIED